jgi:hypothetical protein
MAEESKTQQKLDEESRSFQENWREKYFFVEVASYV